MKSWKKLWKEELDKITPDLREDVKNAPISVDDTVNNGGNVAVISRNKPKIITVTAIILAFICAVITCICLLVPKKSDVFLFAIEINPAVSMCVDSKGKVSGVISSNEDADVIMSVRGVKENIVGKSIDDAIVYYADCAAQLGYIDLNAKGSAVRVSVCSDGNPNKLLNKSQEALKNYFSEKGALAVIVGEEVDGEEFALRSKIEAAHTVEEMRKCITEQSVLYTDRAAAKLGINDIQTLYKSNIVENKLMDIVETGLKDNLDKITSNAEDIQRLFELYYRIYSHEDNPALLLKDYWGIKKYYGDGLTGEFALLVKEMDEALEKYAEDYGVEITCADDLKNAVKGYAAMSVEKISELLENFTAELFGACAEALSEIVRIAGILPDRVSSLMLLPQSKEEYLLKVGLVNEAEYGYRLENFSEEYNRNRTPVSEEEYAQFITQVENEFGSLSQYWQAIKN